MDTDQLVKEILFSTLVVTELGKWLKIQIKKLIIFRHFEKSTFNGIAFNHTPFSATLFNYVQYPEAFFVSADFCT